MPIIILLVIAAITVVALIINLYIRYSVKDRILSLPDAAGLSADCVLVLGAGVGDDGRPSYMLADRLDRGIELYNLGASDRLLMSGDHGRVDYDEVNAMKKYAIDAGIPSDSIFMDHAGFSTYESIYRARDVFKAEKIIIVTQSYHLYRALYIAKRLGLEAYGAASDQARYYGQFTRDVREYIARVKDFVKCIFKPEPTFLGEAIPVGGSGDATNDKEYG